MENFGDDFAREFDMIMMTDDDGNEVEFAIVDAIECDGVKYLLVAEADTMDDEDAEALILKAVSEQEDEITYEMISDEAEFEKVVDLFQEGNDEFDIDIE